MIEEELWLPKVGHSIWDKRLWIEGLPLKNLYLFMKRNRSVLVGYIKISYVRTLIRVLL